jgi:transposase
MKRHGLKTASQTLWDQLWVTSKLLKPTYDALYAAALREPVIGLDQTSWKRLEDKRKKPWQIWCISTPTAIYHQIFDDKGVDSWNELLGSYAGTVICDCLSTHGAKGCNKPGPTLAGCWAHVFRRFREAEEDFSDAGAALEMIQELYDIDARAESIEHLAILRKTESKQVTERLLAWLKSMPVLKMTNFGAALHYVHGHWARFTRFLTDPLIPLDNNRTERAFRGPVIGRRNHFGSKSRRGTRVAALFYSLIESAKLNGINPAEYLMAAVLAARDGRVILPHEYNPPDD